MAIVRSIHHLTAPSSALFPKVTTGQINWSVGHSGHSCGTIAGWERKASKSSHGLGGAAEDMWGLGRAWKQGGDVEA
ncbi:hypothetical protein E4U53_001728 [Claviceps sorghi]|nr:hypothetical protein E4U53_001728 [Claviceps sorghi]